MINKELPATAAHPGKSRAKQAGETRVPKRSRLQPREREQQILEAAIDFFAEKGFDGQMRELARRLGVTSGLLFRYFPNKEALLERVYQEVFEVRWSPRWTEMISVDDVPLKDRLVALYIDYDRVIHTSRWVRIFLYAGLAGLDVSRKYRALLRRTLWPAVLNQVRRHHGMPPAGDEGFTPLEEELIAQLHGMVFHAGIRQWVYRHGVLPTDERIELNIDMFLAGAAAIYTRHRKTKG